MDNQTICGVNIMMINARINALENTLFGYLNVQLEEWEEGAASEYRKMFLQFFAEELGRQKTMLPPALEYFREAEKMLEENILAVKKQIELL